MVSIGYDIDNVIASMIDLSLDLVNGAYKKNYTKEDCVYQTIEDSFGLSTDEVNSLFKQATKDGALLRIKPIEGARKVVNRYHCIFDQYFVTARDCAMQKDTLSWFDINGFCYDPGRVLFENNTPEKKALAVRNLELRLFIEDNLDNANAIAEEAKIPVLLVDFGYPFNRDLSRHHPSIRVVRVWSEIERNIRSLL